MRAGKCQLIQKKIEIKSHIFRQRRFLRLILTSVSKTIKIYELCGGGVGALLPSSVNYV